MAQAGGSLILLVSQPRAGSTLLQRMLGRHPEVRTASERWIALHPCFALRPGPWMPYDHDLARRATQEFLQELPESAEGPGGEDAYWDAARQFLSHLYDRDLAASGRMRLLDKTPRYYFILPELRRLFPAARLVLLIRQPLAVLASLLDTWVRTPDAAAIAGHWHDLISAPALLRDAMQRGDERTLVVRYEELVARPADTMASVSGWLELGPGPDLVEYGEADSPAAWAFGDRGTAFQHGRPVAERAGRWPDVLRRHPIWLALGAVYLDRLGEDLMEALGYSAIDARARLGAGAIAEDDRAAAEALLAGPPSPEALRQAMEAAHDRAAALDRAAADRLAVIEEQRTAISAFEAAVAGRDAEIARLQQALDAATAELSELRDSHSGRHRVWRSVTRRKR